MKTSPIRLMARLMVAGLLIGALPSAPAAAETAGCQSVFVTRGTCALAVSELDGEVSLTVYGDGISAAGLDARIRVWLEDVVTGERLLECMAATPTTDGPVQIACNRTEMRTVTAPFAATCEVEGFIAGRFGCDAIF